MGICRVRGEGEDVHPGSSVKGRAGGRRTRAVRDAEMDGVGSGGALGAVATIKGVPCQRRSLKQAERFPRRVTRPRCR
jgi:hypothetical protein